MPKKIHDLSADRADYTFGDLFYWHCFVFGSRPDIQPTDPIGRIWYPKSVRDALRLKSVKTIWNYVEENSLPFDTAAIEEMLFGESKHYDKERLELRQRLAEARERAVKKVPTARQTGALVPVPGRAVIRYETDYEEDDQADDAEIIGNDRKTAPTILVPVPVPPISRLFVRAGQMLLVSLGIILGAYVWTRLQPDQASKPNIGVTTAENDHSKQGARPIAADRGEGQKPRVDPPLPAPVSPSVESTPRVQTLPPPPQSGSSSAQSPGQDGQPPTPPAQSPPPSVRPASTPPQQPPWTQAERAPVAPPMLEAPAPKAEPPSAPLPTAKQTLPPSSPPPTAVQPAARALSGGEHPAVAAAERERAKKEAEARELNTKLRAMQKGEANDLCARKLEGLSVPGFTLKCDTLIPFGQLLGAVSVSQTASSLGDCAARCERVPTCVAFSFDAGAHAGAASCYLTGSIPAQNPARNWIAGIRN